jgi:hypothetical protein
LRTRMRKTQKSNRPGLINLTITFCS